MKTVKYCAAKVQACFEREIEKIDGYLSEKAVDRCEAKGIIRRYQSTDFN